MAKQMNPEALEKKIFRDCEFFFNQNQQYFEQMKNIVEGTSAIRLVMMDILANSEMFRDYYKNTMKLFMKRYFDAFARSNKRNLLGLNTSIAQMNFFKWATEIGLMDFVKDNEMLALRLMADIRKKTEIKMNKKRKVRSMKPNTDSSDDEVDCTEYVEYSEPIFKSTRY